MRCFHMVVQFLPCRVPLSVRTCCACEVSGHRAAGEVLVKFRFAVEFSPAQSAVSFSSIWAAWEVVGEVLAGFKPITACFALRVLHVHVHGDGSFGQIRLSAEFAREYA